MGFNFRGLAFKQSMMILTGISIVLATIFFVISFQVQSKLSQLLSQRGEQISQANVLYIEKILKDGKLIAEDLATDMESIPRNDEEVREFLSKSLQDARKIVPQITAVVVAFEPGMGAKDAKGEEYMRVARLINNEVAIREGHDYAEKTWYALTREKKSEVWQEPFIGDVVNEPIAVYSTPLYKTDSLGNKVFIGVLCIDLSIDFLKETINSIPISNSGYAIILSAKNNIIAHPKKDFVFKESLKSLSNDNNKLSDFESAILSMKKGVFVGSSLENEECIIYFTSLETSGWTFMIVWPAKEFMEEQRSFGQLFGWISLGGYIVMLILILIISFKVSVPLKKLTIVADKLGRGDFDATIPKINSNDEISHFATAFSNMRQSLKKYIKKQQDMDRIERELDFARNIQLGILPRNEAEEHCNDDRHELSPFLLPAKEVGGDFYDFFKLDNNRLCVVAADVSGKGVPAALFMMVSRIVLRTTATSGKSVAEIFNSTNYELARRNTANMFVTVWMGILDLRTGHMEFASAGHNPPAIRHKDGSVEFAKSKAGLVMAAMEETRYRQQSLDLLPGDMLFLYTDGVTEATNSESELFGDSRLLESLKKGGELSPEKTCSFIKKSIDEFVGEAPQFDDITMLAVKFIGSEEQPAELHEKTVAVDGDSQAALTAFAEETLEPLEGSMKAMMQINIAIDEIISNVVKFSGANKITLRIETSVKDKITAKLTFIDDGVAYNPLKRKDPDTTLSAEDREIGGLGIFIVKKTMDDMTYCRKDDCNHLTITKTL